MNTRDIPADWTTNCDNCNFFLAVYGRENCHLFEGIWWNEGEHVLNNYYATEIPGAIQKWFKEKNGE